MIVGLCEQVHFLQKMGQNRALFVYFHLLHMTQFKYKFDKSIDGVLGT